MEDAYLDDIPLRLAEGSGLSATISLAPQFGGRLGPGDLSQQDLSFYSRRQQSDWTGGRGLEFAQQATNRFRDAVAETRYAGMVALPSAATRVLDSSVPQYQPQGNQGAKRVSAEWVDPGTRVPVTWEAKAISGSHFPLARKFTTVAGFTLSQVKLRLYLSTLSGDISFATMTLRLCADAAGLPGSVLNSVTLPVPSTTPDWVAFSLSASLSAGTTYWLVLTANDALYAGVEFCVGWIGADTNNFYSTTSATDFGGGWGYIYVNLYFITNNGYASGTPYFMPTVISRQRQAQRFQSPGGLPLTMMNIYVRQVAWSGATGSVTLRLYSDSAGAPGAQITSATLNPADFADVQLGAGWVSASLTATLTSGTYYWLILEADAGDDASNVVIDWSANLDGGYLVSRYATVQDAVSFGAWQSQTASLFFAPNGARLNSMTVKPVEFKGKWYAGAGTDVYRFNTGLNAFDLVYTTAQPITNLAEIGGYIYVAQGDSADMVRSATGDAGSWSAITGRAYTYLLRYNGYLNCLKGQGGAGAFAYTTDPTNSALWAEITAASSEVTFTELVGFRGEVMLVADKGLFSVSSSYVYQVDDWSQQRHADNGKGALVWVANNLLYIPLRNSLLAYDGASKIPSGIETAGEYLPAIRQGRVSCMIGMGAWLLFAIDAGPNGRSAIYAFNGRGFHCLTEAQILGKRIRAMGFEGITSNNPRLWWWEDADACYINMPELTDNPYGFAGSRFQSAGYVHSARLLGETGNIVKDFAAVELLTSDCVAGAQEVDIYIRVDNGPAWSKMGTITRSPRQRITFTTPNVAAKTTGAGCTDAQIVLATGNTGDLAPAGFVRIGAEVGQVLAVVNASTFTLVVPLSEAPAAGATVRGTTPAGREIEYQMILRTNDNTKTPRVLDVMVIYQEQLLDKAIIPITVRCGRNMTLRSGAPYPYTAGELREKLIEIARLVKPVKFVDWNGRDWWVKVRALSESGIVREDDQMQNERDISSTLSLTLVEV